MSRFFIVLFTVAGVTFASSSFAMSFQVSFPILTFPPKPSQDTSADCSAPSAEKGDICADAAE